MRLFLFVVIATVTRQVQELFESRFIDAAGQNYKILIFFVGKKAHYFSLLFPQF